MAMFEDIYRQIQEIEDYDVLYDYEELQHSVELLNRNYRLLEKVMNVESELAELMETHNRWLLNDKMDEIRFLIHNYVASVKSLLDHSRRLYKKLFNDESEKANYEALIQEYLSENHITFVEDLRSMMQHRSLINIGVSYGRIDGFYIPIDNLMRFTKWRHNSKEYLKTLKYKEIPITELFSSYHDRVTSFHEKVQERVFGLYQTELEAMHDLHAQNTERLAELYFDALRDVLNRFRKYGYRGVKGQLAMGLDADDQKMLALSAESDRDYCLKAFDLIKSSLPVPQDIEEKFQNLMDKH